MSTLTEMWVQLSKPFKKCTCLEYAGFNCVNQVGNSMKGYKSSGRKTTEQPAKQVTQREPQTPKPAQPTTPAPQDIQAPKPQPQSQPSPPATQSAPVQLMQPPQPQTLTLYTTPAGETYSGWIRNLCLDIDGVNPYTLAFIPNPDGSYRQVQIVTQPLAPIQYIGPPANPVAATAPPGAPPGFGSHPAANPGGHPGAPPGFGNQMAAAMPTQELQLPAAPFHDLVVSAPSQVLQPAANIPSAQSQQLQPTDFYPIQQVA